jgi:predicted transcriptional regulator
MRKSVCISLDEELLTKGHSFALQTHRSFSAVVEMSLQKFLDDNDGRE